MRRSRRGHADPTLVMTPAPSVPALVRCGSLAVATVGLMACGADERTGSPPPPDGAVHTGGTGAGAVPPMVPPGPGGAPMVGPMPPMIAPMPDPGTGGRGSGGAPMFPPFGSGGAPMFPPFGSGGAPMPYPWTGGAPNPNTGGGSGTPPIIAPMPPPPPMPAPIPASLPRKR